MTGRITVLQLVIVAILPWRIEAEKAFCGAGELEVRTGWLEKDDVECGTLISSIADFYDENYRRECQRWMGTPEMPPSIAKAYIIDCRAKSRAEQAKYVKYKVKVCCEEPTNTDYEPAGMACFSCNDVPTKDDDGYFVEECNHQSRIEICSADQVCQTEFTFGSIDSPRKAVTKRCADRKACHWAQDDNIERCQNIPTPRCSYCCEGAYCNYNFPDLIPHMKPAELITDACQRQPCYYAATCESDTSVARGYRCICPPGRTGPTCKSHPTHHCSGHGASMWNKQRPYYTCHCFMGYFGQNCSEEVDNCDESGYCLHGGTCFNYREYGLRCVCPEEYTGSHCEIKNPVCSSPDRLFVMRDTRMVTLKRNCTELVRWLSNIAFQLDFCVRKMNNVFKVGIDGDVRYNEFGALDQCKRSHNYQFIRLVICCQACLSAPCQNGGWCIPIGAEYVCKCRFGYEGKHCENKISMCFASGDPHYRTFDGEMIHFQGECKYVLAAKTIKDHPELIPFEVLAKNEHRNGDTSWSYTKYIEVNVFGYSVRLGRGKVITVDGDQVVPDVNFPGFIITNNGDFVRLVTNFSLIVESDGRWTATVKIPESYTSCVIGLCGDADHNAGNDLRLRNTTDVRTSKYRYSLVGNSWQVDDLEHPECQARLDPDPPECVEPMLSSVTTNKYCGLLTDKGGVFRSCVTGLPDTAKSYAENCAYDVCANQLNADFARQAACGSLEAFAAECFGKGYAANWREIADCPLACGANMIYKHSAAACHATCAYPDAPEQCNLPDTESCVCVSDDFVLFGDSCISAEACGCPDRQTGGIHPIGDTWLSDGCSVQHKCVVCDSCRRPVGSVVTTKTACEDGFSCIDDSAGMVCIDTSDPCANGACDPVDGGWSEWSDWDACSATCGMGSFVRTRACTEPAPTFGGSECAGDVFEDQACFLQECTVDGEWSEWGAWGDCSQTCDDGVMARQRWCDSPLPSLYGQPCGGDNEEMTVCRLADCRPVVDGGWRSWSEWSPCSEFCGPGWSNRRRACDEPEPENGGMPCIGDEEENVECTEKPCALVVPGGWRSWSSWGPCSVTCGRGMVTRLRSCDDPLPDNGGRECVGDGEEMRECTGLSSCPVDGGWCDWSEWGSCSVSCGAGVTARTRQCDTPVPQHGGRNCSCASKESAACSIKHCPVDGGWSTWSYWSICSGTRGAGSRLRVRVCSDPYPMDGGRSCDGQEAESEGCSVLPEEVRSEDGEWTEWGQWSDCSATCDHDTSYRTRECRHVSPVEGGVACEGESVDSRPCGKPTPVVNSDLLYPYGEAQNDERLVCKEGATFCSSDRIATPHIAFKEYYLRNVQVHTNGYITLARRYVGRSPLPLLDLVSGSVRQSGFALLAPLWAENDARVGAVYYQVYDGSRSDADNRTAEVVARACRDAAWHSGSTGETWVLVVTWAGVMPLRAGHQDEDKPNTFQLVLIYDTIHFSTYALFLYQETGWDPCDRLRRANTIGYYFAKYGSEQSKPLEQSGQQAAFRMARLPGNTGIIGKYFFKFAQNASPRTALKCRRWYSAQRQRNVPTEVPRRRRSCPYARRQYRRSGRKAGKRMGKWNGGWRAMGPQGKRNMRLGKRSGGRMKGRSAGWWAGWNAARREDGNTAEP